MVTKSGDTYSVSAGTSESTIQNLIESAPSGAIIQLGAGTFTFSRTLLVDRSDITLRGAGSDKTIIASHIPNNDASATIKVTGAGDGPHVTTVSSSGAIGSKSLTLSSTAGLKVGEIVHIEQPNDRAWLDSIGDFAIPVDALPLREMLVRVTGITGHTVSLAEPAPYAFQAGKATISDLRPLHDVSVGGFRIETPFGTANPNDFSNRLPAWEGVSTFEIDNATASTLHDIKLFNSGSHGFLIAHDYRTLADHLSTEGSWNKGEGGNGYAFQLYGSFANHLSALSDRDMRHSVLFSSWHAEHYNVISVTSTNRDINFHGSPDSDNVVRVARSVLQFGSTGHEAAAVEGSSYPAHPLSTIAANDVTFKYLRAGDRADTVHADPTGADIATGGRNDVIFGGASADRIDGGTGDDRMSGGGGSDRFVRAHGDGTDTITDFKTGSSGDRIELDDYAFRSFTEIRISQQGSDALVDLGADGGILLKGVSAAGLTAANFSLVNLRSTGISGIISSKVYFVGSDGNDSLQISPTGLKSGATLVLGAGVDTLSVIAAKSLTLDTSGFGNFHGVDALNFDKVGKLYLTLDDRFLGQSDKGTVTVSSDSGIARLDVGTPSAGHAVLIAGHGTFQLAGGRAQSVQIADQAVATVDGGDHGDAIRGGHGNDVISGGGGGDFLSGGGGTDRLTGGSGADRFVFMTGFGHDTITDFSASADRLVIGKTLLGGEQLSHFAHQSGSNTVLDFGHDILTLDNINVHTLSTWHVDFV